MIVSLDYDTWNTRIYPLIFNTRLHRKFLVKSNNNATSKYLQFSTGTRGTLLRAIIRPYEIYTHFESRVKICVSEKRIIFPYHYDILTRSGKEIRTWICCRKVEEIISATLLTIDIYVSLELTPRSSKYFMENLEMDTCNVGGSTT